MNSRLYHDLALVLEAEKLTADQAQAVAKDLEANDWYCKVKADDKGVSQKDTHFMNYTYRNPKCSSWVWTTRA